MKTRYKSVRAAGGSREVLDALTSLCDGFEFDPLESIYVLGRLLPVLRDAHESAVLAEASTIRLGSYGLLLPFASSMMSLVSSGFVPPAYQGYSLVALGLFSGLHTLLIGYLTLNQPGLTWLGSRRIFMSVSRELTLWLADVGVYDGLEQNTKFQLLQTRCEAVISLVEEATARQIQGLLTVAVEASDKVGPDGKKSGKEAGKEASKEAGKEPLQPGPPKPPAPPRGLG